MVQSNVYRNAVVLVCLIVVPTNVCSYAIDQTASIDTVTLQVLNEFRARLVTEGVLHDQKELTMETFDELEILRLLPIVISFMRANALSSLEQDAFEHIYGSIWELVVEESHRHRGQSRNAILTALLASPEIRQTKSKADAHHNAIAKTTKPDTPTSMSREAPSQRVLHRAAMIVQKYYQRQTKQTTTNKRKASRARQTQRLRSANVHAKQLSSDSIRVTIELPRYKRSIAKPKPSPAKHGDQEDEEELEDPEMEAKILAAIQAQIGNPSLEEEDDEEEEDDVQLGEDSSEYLDDEPDYMGILGDDDDDDDDDDSEDEEEDDNYFANGLLRASVQEYENPSFNELLLLAARHRAVQQRRQKQQHHLGHRKSSSTVHSSYEDY